MDANSRKPGQPNAHGVAAEPDRVSTGVVIGLYVVLIAVAVVGAVVTFGVFRGLENGAAKADRASIAAAGMENREPAVPPLPRLQVFPVQHWQDFRSAEQARLTSYGWMDKTTGVVHVPIERAMDLVVERGVGPLDSGPAATAPTETKK